MSPLEALPRLCHVGEYAGLYSGSAAPLDKVLCVNFASTQELSAVTFHVLTRVTGATVPCGRTVTLWGFDEFSLSLHHVHCHRKDRDPPDNVPLLTSYILPSS